MDEETRQRRQREFTIYLVLFILLVIVGKITTNGQLVDQRPAYRANDHHPYGSGIYSHNPYAATPYPSNYGYDAYGYPMNGFHASPYGNGPPFGGGVYNNGYYYEYPPFANGMGYNPNQPPPSYWNYGGQPQWNQGFGPLAYETPYFRENPYYGVGPQHPGFHPGYYDTYYPNQNPYSHYQAQPPVHHGWGHPMAYGNDVYQHAYYQGQTWNQPYYPPQVNQGWW